MTDSIPSIIREAYYTGQLLNVADFNREQDFHIQYRNFQTRQLLSAGIISGLSVNTDRKSITVISGAAVNNNGEYILLTAEKSYTIIEADGDYQLVIKPQWVAIPGEPNQLKSDPELNLIATGAVISEGILLANVTIKDKLAVDIRVTHSPVKILSSILPEQSIQNLDAAVITKGIFNKNLIPPLQDLNGKLTQAQLPELTSDLIPALQDLNGKLTQAQLPVLMDNSSVIIDNSFTAGVLTGLEVSSVDKILQLKNGIAIDQSANQLILDKNATYDNVQITLVKGFFSLDMSDAVFKGKAWFLFISQNSDDPNTPILEFINSDAPIPGKVILTGIRVNEDSLIINNDYRSNVLLRTDRLPQLTSDFFPNLQDMTGKLTQTQLPELTSDLLPGLQDLTGKLTETQLPELTPNLIPGLQDLNGKIAIKQLPEIQEMNGKLNAVQIPDLQNLSGQLTTQQLPPDMDVSKEYVTFFVNEAVVSIGTKIQLSWKANNGVDSLSLSYFSEKGINILSTDKNDIQLIQSNYSYTPLKTTTFTLTAQRKGNTLDQKQLTITVVTLLNLAELQFQNNSKASDSVAQLKNQFPLTTAQESATVLAKVGYAFEDTGRAVKNSYNITDPAVFGRMMAAAFPA